MIHATVQAAAAANGIPPWAYILVGLAVVIGPVITAIVILRKQPAETRKITVDTVDVNVKVAGELRDDAVEAWRAAREQLTEAQAAIAAQRADFEQYKVDVEARMAELSAQLRGKVAENQHLKAELALRDEKIADRDERIDQLEAEVRELKQKVARLENGHGEHGDTSAGP